MNGVIECSCGATAAYNVLETECPNDVIIQCPGWAQDDNGEWRCPDCNRGNLEEGIC